MLIPRGKKKYKSFVFVMGLLSNKSTNLIKKFTNKFFLSIFLKTFDKLIFLGKPEYEKAIRNFQNIKINLFFFLSLLTQSFGMLKKTLKKKMIFYLLEMIVLEIMNLY